MCEIALVDAVVSKRMRANRSSDTGPELQLRQALRTIGLRGYRLHYRKAPGRPDIAFVSSRVAVFVNGCFWHDCPKCKRIRPKQNAAFWDAKIRGNVNRDERTGTALQTAGWTRVIAWECAVREDALAVAECVRAQIASRSGTSRGKKYSGG
jgi:DNA mismatch endonuclease (patch repair protein)